MTCLMEKRYFSRRKAIILPFIALMVMLIAMSCSSGGDASKFSAAGQRIVMWKEVPTVGTVVDYDDLDNLAFAAQKLYTSGYFRGETTGAAVADAGITKVTQKISNVRVVKGDKVFSESISVSSMVKVAQQKYLSSTDNGKFFSFLKRDGETKGMEASWNGKVQSTSEESYYNSFGLVPNELCKYYINYDEADPTKTSIISINGKSYKNTDSGVETSAAEDDNNEYGLQEDGTYIIHIELDPTLSTMYYQSEVRTLAGATTNPTFKKVTMTLTVSPDWTPISVATYERYDVVSMGFNADTVAQCVETFSDFGAVDKEVPYADVFEPYVGSAPVDGGDTATKGALDYLTAAFGDYITGVKPLDLKASITGLTSTPITAYVSADLATMNVRAQVDGLDVHYKDNRVYIKLNDINAYLDISAFSKITATSELQSLMQLLPAFSIPDTETLLGAVFAEATVSTDENMITTVRLPFTLELSDTLSVGIDASILIDESTSNLEFKSLSGKVTIGDMELTVSAAPQALNLADITANAKDISAVADLINSTLNTISQKKLSYDYSVSVLDYTLNGNISIDRTNADDVKVSLTAKIGSEVITANYFTGSCMAYITIGDTTIKADVYSLPDLINSITNLLPEMESPIDLNAVMSKVQTLLPKTTAEIFSIIKEIECTNESFSLGLSYLDSQIHFAATHANNILTGFGVGGLISVPTNLLPDSITLPEVIPFTIELFYNGEMSDIKEPENAASVNAILNKLLPVVEKAINAQNYTLDIEASINRTNIDARVNIYKNGNASAVVSVQGSNSTLNVYFTNNTVYISAAGGLNFKFALSDFDKVRETLRTLATAFPAYSDILNAISDFDLNSISIKDIASKISTYNLADTILSYLKYIKLSDDELMINMPSCQMLYYFDSCTLIFAAHNDNLDVDGTAHVDFDTAPAFFMPNYNYIDMASLLPIVTNAANLINSKSISVNGTLTLKAPLAETFTYTVDYILATNAVQANLKSTSSDVSIKLTVIDNVMYLNIYRTAKSADILALKIDLATLSSYDFSEFKLTKSFDLGFDIKSLISALTNSGIIPTDSVLVNVDISPVMQILNAIKDLTGNETLTLIDTILNDLTLSLENDQLSLTTNLLDLSAKISFALNLSTASVNVDKVADITANISASELDGVNVSGEYIDFEQLYNLARAACYTANESGLDFKFSLNTGNNTFNGHATYMNNNGKVAIRAAIDIFGEQLTLTVFNGVCYIEFDEFLGSFDLNDTANVIEKISALGIIPELGGASVNINSLSDILNFINSIHYDASGKLVANANMLGKTLTAKIDYSPYAITGISISGMGIDFNTTVKTASGFTFNPSELQYINLNTLANLIDSVYVYATADGLQFKLALAAANQNLTFDCAVAFKPLSVSLTSGNVSAYFTDNTLYVKLGDSKVLSGTIADINSIISMLGIEGISMPQLNTPTQIVEFITAALTSITLTDNNLCIDINALNIQASVAIKLNQTATDINAIAVSLNVNNSPIAVELSGITAASPTITPPAATAKLVDILPFVDEALNLTSLSVNTTIEALSAGTTLSGTANLDVELSQSVIDLMQNGIPITAKVRGTVNLLGVTVQVTLIDNNIYLSLGNLKIAADISNEGITTIINAINEVLPADKQISLDTSALEGVLSSLTSDILGLADYISKLSVDSNGALSIGIKMGSGVISSGNFALNNLGFEFTAHPAHYDINAAVDFTADATDYNIGLLGSLSLNAVEPISVPVSSYVLVTDLLQYVKPVYDLVNQGKEAKLIKLNIDAYVLTSANTQTRVTGNVYLNLTASGFDLELNLDLFDGTDSKTPLKLVIKDNTVYISVGDIKLSANKSDAITLCAVLSDYLPAYLVEQIEILFGLRDGSGQLGDLAIIVNKLTSLPTTPLAMISALGDEVYTASGSLLSMLVGMLQGFSYKNNALTVSAEVMGIVINVTPYVANDAISEVVISTSLAGNYLKLTANKLSLSSTAGNVNAPDDSNLYTSIMTFVEYIDNAVKTLTTKNANGDITFTANIPQFTSVGTSPVTDDKGVTLKYGTDNLTLTDVAVEGLIAKKTGNENTENTALTAQLASYKINLHAKLTMETVRETYNSKKAAIQTKTVRTGIELFVITTDSKNEVILHYTELSTSGSPTVKMYIDYDSTMDIIAALLHIMGVEQATIVQLVGSRNIDIDTSVFESMDIIGLDGLRSTLERVVSSLNTAGDAFGYLTNAWDAVVAAGSIENLNNNKVAIMADVNKAIDLFKSILASTPTPSDGVATDIDGAMFNKVVNGVSFAYANNELSANVDNAITTGSTIGDAVVKVTRSNNVISGISVSNLDASTDLNATKRVNMNMTFTAGKEVNIVSPITSGTPSSNGYYDFSNVKHMLFDLVNTANLMEFELGSGSEDLITVSVLGIKFKISYNIKVGIIDNPDYTPTNGKPLYTTYAAVAITIPSAVGAVEPGTNYIFYCNDKLYVQGIKVTPKFMHCNYTPINMRYTIEQFTSMTIEDIMMNFMFFIVPFSRTYTGFVDIHKEICKAIQDSSNNEKNPTLATVLKNYAYNYADNGSYHNINIDLVALSGDSNLSTLDANLYGYEGSDATLRDNYLTKITASTTFVSIVGMDLTGTLSNIKTNNGVPVLDGNGDLQSTGLSQVNSKNGSCELKDLPSLLNNISWTDYDPNNKITL